MADFLIREHAKPGEYGCKPEERPIEEYIRNGIIVLDKWQGPASHDVTEFVRKKMMLEKTGHAGTLDPAVSGVLPITLENSCKIVSILQRVDKEYVGVIHFHKDVAREAVEKISRKFIGIIKQKPPRKSAVARKVRKRRIYDIRILDNNSRNFCVYVKCEAGTYIRVLFHQLGEALKTGAHMKELRRIRSGNFNEEQSQKIHDVIEAFSLWKEKGVEDDIRKVIVPMERSIEHLKKIIVKDSAIHSIANGSPLYTTGIAKIQENVVKNDIISILSLKGELVAIGLSDMSAKDMIEKKGIAVKINRVIMKKSIYPKTVNRYRNVE